MDWTWLCCGWLDPGDGQEFVSVWLQSLYLLTITDYQMIMMKVILAPRSVAIRPLSGSRGAVYFSSGFKSNRHIENKAAPGLTTSRPSAAPVSTRALPSGPTTVTCPAVKKQHTLGLRSCSSYLLTACVLSTVADNLLLTLLLLTIGSVDGTDTDTRG